MTILTGDHFVIETVEQFTDRTKFDTYDIARAIEVDEKIESIVDTYDELYETGDTVPVADSVDDIPKDIIQEILHHELGVGSFKMILDTLEADDSEWIHLYNGTTHDIVRVHDR